MTLEEKIAQLETELVKVKAELAESKRTVWKPNDRDPFYYVSNDGSISSKTLKRKKRKRPYLVRNFSKSGQ